MARQRTDQSRQTQLIRVEFKSRTCPGRVSGQFQVRARLLFVIGLAACSSREQLQPPGVFTVAVAGDQVFVGQSHASGHSGVFEVGSLSGPRIQCRGHFNYSEPPNGSAIFACSSGEHGTLRLSADGPYVGTGTGSSSFGPVRVLFGYSLAEVNRRIIPHGKRLVVTAEGTSLVDAQ